jgi:hypothetical protein
MGVNMNIEKIFKAVGEDEMNSPLISICSELEKQRYKIKVEGLEVTTDDLETELFNDLERATNNFNLELTKNNGEPQRFKLVFTDYHKFNFESF